MALTARALRRSLLIAPMLAHKGRLALSLAAISLGVALGYSVQLINRVAVNEFSHALKTLSGDADLSVHGPRSGFTEELYPRIAALPEVTVASPVIELEARLHGRHESLKVLGLDVFRAARVQPALAAAEGGESLDFLRPERIFLSRSAAQWLSLNPGDELEIQIGLRKAGIKVAGILSASAVRERLGVMDIAAVQRDFARRGAITRLDLRLRPGVDAEAFAARLRAELPRGLALERPQASVERSALLSRAYRVNLDVLALVALFTGSLLVFSMQMLAVVRRRTELALLRALGMTRAALVRQMILESALVGALGSAIGLALGHFASGAMLARYGADLGAAFFRGIEPTTTVDVGGLALFAMLGIAAAVGGGLAAAVEAGRAEPARALRAGDEELPLARLRRAGPGIGLIAAGALLTLAPPLGGLPLAGYLAIGLLLIGVILLVPRFSAIAFRLIPRAPRVPVRLALDQLRQAPGQASVSLAAIVASVSLMASMVIMVASFRQSLAEWLVQVLPADLYVRTPFGGDTAYLSPSDQSQIARASGVRRVEFLRIEQLLLSREQPRVTLLARTLDPAQPERNIPLVGEQRLPERGEPPPAWISEAMVDLYGFGLGEVIELPIGGQSARFTVAGVWRDYVRQHGTVLITEEAYQALSGDRNANNAVVWLEEGASAAAVGSAIRAALPREADVEISGPGEIRDLSMKIFDRTFAVTYALEAAAVLIGLFALSSSFGALALGRRREFGMLRHLGMTRRQIGTMLAFEGALISVLGVAVGLALGWLLSLILIHVVNRQSFHWSMDMHMPWMALAGFVAVMVSLASLAAWAGARQAMTQDAVRAVKDVW